MNNTIKSRHCQEFKDLAARILSKEISRLEAAEISGINPGTLGVWLSRSKLNSPRNEDGTKRLHGAALERRIVDPEKSHLLDEAVAKVLDGEMSATEASERYKSLTLVTISTRVRRERAKLGLTLIRRRTKKELEEAGVKKPSTHPKQENTQNTELPTETVKELEILRYKVEHFEKEIDKHEDDTQELRDENEELRKNLRELKAKPAVYQGPRTTLNDVLIAQQAMNKADVELQDNTNEENYQKKLSATRIHEVVNRACPL